jgi:hypothetical protein
VTQASGLYLYAIVGKRPRGALGTGMNGGALALVRAGGAHVVVERASAPEPTPRAVRGHDRIVKRIAASTSAVLPFRFGSVVEDRAAVRGMLDPVTSAVAKALEVVDGCVQYTLRVYGEATRAAPGEAAAEASGPGTQWLRVRLRARRVPEIAPVTDATLGYVRAARTERHDRPPLVASVYHLVPRAKARAYRTALGRAARALPNVEIKISGPWPPYAFAELP